MPTKYVAGSAITATRTRPRPWASKKFRSIATRTLAVAASLFSPSLHPQQQQNGDAHSLCALPSATAFRLDSPRRIAWKYPREAKAIIGQYRSSQHRDFYPHQNNYHAINHASRRFFLSMTGTAEDESVTPISTAESTSHLPRLFVQLPAGQVDKEAVVRLRQNALVPLNADQEHYLLDVMRITNPKRWGKKTSKSSFDYTGCVRIFNGVDGEWLAKVVVAEDATPKKQARRKRGSGNDPATTVLECLEELQPQDQQSDARQESAPRPSIQIDLCLGYIRDKQRRRWVFEKATELGVDSIQILETDFCHKDTASYKKKKDLPWEEDEREKHEKHVIEAAEQCERLTVPSVGKGVWTVDTLVSENIGNNDNKNENDNHLWLVCRERSEASPPILSVLEEVRALTADATNSESNCVSTIHVLVGPEGGWSPRELEIFSSLDAVQFVSLGPLVLRAETAAITAVASIQMHREIAKSDYY